MQPEPNQPLQELHNPEPAHYDVNWIWGLFCEYAEQDFPESLMLAPLLFAIDDEGNKLGRYLENEEICALIEGEVEVIVDEEDEETEGPDHQYPCHILAMADTKIDELPSHIANLFKPKINRHPWQGKLFAKDLGYTVEPNTREQISEIYDTLAGSGLIIHSEKDYILDALVETVEIEGNYIGRPLTEKEIRYTVLDDDDGNSDWPCDTPWWWSQQIERKLELAQQAPTT